jgi:hypothetical protein
MTGLQAQAEQLLREGQAALNAATLGGRSEVITRNAQIAANKVSDFLRTFGQALDREDPDYVTALGKMVEDLVGVIAGGLDARVRANSPQKAFRDSLGDSLGFEKLIKQLIELLKKFGLVGGVALALLIILSLGRRP